MPKPTALQLAMRTLRDAPVVDISASGRVSGQGWDRDVERGRYVLVDVRDMAMTLKRLAAVEASAQLARLARKHRSGRHSLTRR